MKKIIKTATDIFLIILGLTFLFSCTFFDKQAKKETRETPPKAAAIPKETKTKHKQEIKESSPKVPAAAGEKHHEHKASPRQPESPTTPEKQAESNNQQKYYNVGMRYYSQEKYLEAKQAWQKVIKLGKRTALADKARENIKKVDQILKTLKEMSGR